MERKASEDKWIPIDEIEDVNQKKDDSWETLCESEEMNIDWGTIIGSFVVGEAIVKEMGKIGDITYPHKYIVYIHPNEGTIPHFHVFDKAGMHRNETHKDGFHTCVGIKTNESFKHGAYTDDLDKDAMKALDRFLSAKRPENKSDAGLTNYEHTIREWNANNANDSDETSIYYVDPKTQKPDYTTIMDNL